MRFYSRKPSEDEKGKGTPDTHSPTGTPVRGKFHHTEVNSGGLLRTGKVPAVAVILGAVASIGGFMFGYESGQISGELALIPV
jgi:MFS transporter, SP family, sugar:H+ symporter